MDWPLPWTLEMVNATMWPRLFIQTGLLKRFLFKHTKQRNEKASVTPLVVGRNSGHFKF